MIYSSKKEWQALKYNFSDMADFEFYEDRLENSLKFYITTFMFELSGMINNNTITEIYSIYPNPYTVLKIRDISIKLNYKYDNLKKYIKENQFFHLLPFSYFNREEIIKILFDVLYKLKFNYHLYKYIIPKLNSSEYNYSKTLELDIDFIDDFYYVHKFEQEYGMNIYPLTHELDFLKCIFQQNTDYYNTDDLFLTIIEKYNKLKEICFSYGKGGELFFAHHFLDYKFIDNIQDFYILIKKG